MVVFAVFDLYICPQLWQHGKQCQHSVFAFKLLKYDWKEGKEGEICDLIGAQVCFMDRLG